MYSRSFNVILFTISIIYFHGWVYSSLIHVSIQDPIYEYLNRMETQGVLTTYMNGTLPLTRDYIAKLLHELEQQREKLSSVDQKILDEYISDYRHELTDKPYFQLREKETTYHPFQSWQKMKIGMKDVFSYSEMQGDHHLVVYETEDNLVWFDVGGIARNEIKNSEEGE